MLMEQRNGCNAGRVVADGGGQFPPRNSFAKGTFQMFPSPRSLSGDLNPSLSYVSPRHPKASTSPSGLVASSFDMQRELQQMRVLLNEKQEWHEQGMHQHKKCHDEAFSTLASEVQKLAQQQSVTTEFMRIIHPRIDELTLNSSTQISRIGQLEEDTAVNHLKVERMASLLRMVHEQQLRLTRSLQGHVEEFREQHNLPQEPNQQHPKKDSSSLGSAIHSSDFNQHDLDAERQHSDGHKSFHCLESCINSWEEGHNDTDKLVLLLKDVQEERFSVNEMLDNVRQEKLEVIAAMHTFHVDKTDAIQEMKGLWQAAQDELATYCSKHKNELSELLERMLSQATQFSSFQLIGSSGRPSVSPAYCGTTIPASPMQLVSPAAVQYAGSGLQPSLSSKTVMGALSPTVPTSSNCNDPGNLRRRFKFTPRGVSPYTTSMRPADS